MTVQDLFLSTPSARRATLAGSMGKSSAEISIHALREEGDPSCVVGTFDRSEFLSTPSARRATFRHPADRRKPWDFYPRPPRGGRRCPGSRWPGSSPISIHALREEGDGDPRCELPKVRNFYPRPPRGGRLTSGCSPVNLYSFLSTPSARRATLAIDVDPMALKISIHALREEGDEAQKEP